MPDYKVEEPDSMANSGSSWTVLSPDNLSVSSEEAPLVSPEEIAQLQTLRLRTSPQSESETWFVYDQDWLDNLVDSCRISSMNNGQLLDNLMSDNSPDQLTPLTPNLTIGAQIDVVSQDTWTYIKSLAAKYVTSIDIEIPRGVMRIGRELQVELYPRYFYVVSSSHPTPAQIFVSSTSTFSGFKDTIKSSLGLPEGPVKLFLKASGNFQVISASDEKRISEIAEFCGVGDELMVVQENQSSVQPLFPDEGELPESQAILALPAADLDHTPTHAYSPSQSATFPGLVGLNNLGNTCFMNSALQCLLHTTPLVKFFKHGNFSADLNQNNPLGYGGKLATEFGRLVDSFYPDSHRPNSSFAPRELKHLLSMHAPQFSGYQQHDAQELLAFLLDGLHEDLNRILKKPYVEAPDGKEMSDEELAAAAWSRHKLRNDSAIVDVFQGLFKSALTCNICGKISRTFDPYMYLSLPLPAGRKWVVCLGIIARDGPMEHYEFSLFCSAEKLKEELLKYSHSLIFGRGEISDFSFFVSSQGDLSMIPGEIKETRDMRPMTVHCLIEFRLITEEHESSKIVPETAGQSTCHFIAFRLVETESTGWRASWGRLIGVPIRVEISSVGELTAAAQDAARRILGVEGEIPPISIREGLNGDVILRPGYAWNPKPDGLLKTESTVYSCDLIAGEWLKGFWENIHAGNIHADLNLDTASLETKDQQTFTPGFYKLSDWLSSRLIQRPSKTEPSEEASLESCFELFSESEQLSEDDKWYCSHCKEHVRAWKKLEIYSLPEIAVIHLKRFKGMRSKLGIPVDVPERINLKKYTIGTGDQHYRLFAVSHHHGSLYSGHYVADALHEDKWWNFNDSHVSEISSPLSDKSSPYLLFYARE